MTPEQQKMVDSKLYTRQPEGEPPVRSSEWLADMVERWRNAEKHWRKQASARERSYGGQPIYEDGLAEALGRCADILANDMSANHEGVVPGQGHPPRYPPPPIEGGNAT